MPASIKLAISVLVALVAVGTWYVETTMVGRGDLGWVAVGLGVLMILAMWIFPEASKKDGNKAS